MSKLPVIVGFGGINAAGRSSGHHGYRRMVIDALGETAACDTLNSLASLMNLRRRSSDDDAAVLELDGRLCQLCSAPVYSWCTGASAPPSRWLCPPLVSKRSRFRLPRHP